MSCTTEPSWDDQEKLEKLIEDLLAYDGDNVPLLAAKGVLIAFQEDGSILTPREALVKIGREDLTEYLEETPK